MNWENDYDHIVEEGAVGQVEFVSGDEILKAFKVVKTGNSQSGIYCFYLGSMDAYNV